jgi:meso-butanediol dehydrogenase / (S,S)-butanediol dehydrogenase / diacetyl reductase
MTRNALVTGAARGIGRAIALRLARDGLNVCVNDIRVNSSALAEIRREIESLGQKSVATTADVSIDTEVEAMMQHTAKVFGSLDVSYFFLRLYHLRIFLSCRLSLQIQASPM